MSSLQERQLPLLSYVTQLLIAYTHCFVYVVSTLCVSPCAHSSHMCVDVDYFSQWEDDLIQMSC